MDTWKRRSKRLIKSELIKRGVSHEELAKRLNQLGIEETKSSIDSKISRGTFSAAFLLQSLYVLECDFLQIRVADDSNLKIAAEPIIEYRTTTKNG